MSIYAIGDIQGCFSELQHLLDEIRFEPEADQLWFVGDLVNRGPESLEVLRFVKSLGDRAVTVLGNHDLHLLAVAEGAIAAHRSDTLDAILNAPDRDELLTWLRHQRLLHSDGNYVMVHAGLLPQWSVKQATRLAREVETELRSSYHAEFLRQMYGNSPAAWRDELSGYKRWRVIINALTRMRVCTPQGEMEFKFKGELSAVPEGYLPWYRLPRRRHADATIIFGHWSALGLIQTEQIIALDTGCLWGGKLSAMRLEDRQLFQVESQHPVATHW